ncbi:MAG: hypothetical protein ACLFQB_10975 [Chitinispirillaceae bacterium]
MVKRNHYIVGIHVDDRVHHVPSVQDIFTRFGCYIKTRIGLHDADNEFCSPNGLIIVELVGDEGRFQEFTSALRDVQGVDVKHMVFEHR